MSIHIRSRLGSSFSLVEVVLALGVIAFSLVAILGVFPAGLASNRASVNDTRAAQLAHAITSTIDAQCITFSSVTCFGLPLNLATLNTSGDPPDPPLKLYAGYPSPEQPTISDTEDADSIYTIELRFNNDPAVTSTTPPIKLGPNKVNQIEIRIYGKLRSEGFVEFSYLARNKA